MIEKQKKYGAENTSEKRNGRQNIFVDVWKFSAILLYFLHSNSTSSNNKWPFINLELDVFFFLPLFLVVLLPPSLPHRIWMCIRAAPQKHMDLHSAHFMRKWRKYYVKRAKYFAQYLYNFINFFFKKRRHSVHSGPCCYCTNICPAHWCVWRCFTRKMNIK